MIRLGGIVNLKALGSLKEGTRSQVGIINRNGKIASTYVHYDGYPRNIKNGFVYVNGFRARIVGVISMDLITVDVTKITNVEIGSDVELWGDKIPIEIVAKKASTIPYELLVKVTSRVIRKIIHQR